MIPTQNQPRRVVTHISPISINYLHLRKPWIPAWWSAAFPGYGHLMLCKYVTAYILIAWEIFINTKSRLNTAIFYSMNGQFPKAMKELNKEWILLYVPVYLFCIWDCYRRTVQYNQEYLLGFRENEEQSMISVNISTWELNVLDKRKPYIALVWSLLFPGLGHLYLNRLPSVIFCTIWFVVIIQFGHILPAIHYTFYGHFAAAKAVLDPQWLLYIPSIYVFFAYDAYMNAVEYNKLYEREQARYIKNNYQDRFFKKPI
ncbi:hypothetical protein [Neobacillus cucumis]|uniref:hypothetical protein n=1 Tax=Neobacillus cucumis TaxID=1740721 RepID=UPI001C60E649|nr:hypothetical protein [Neobacillus cucumis]